MKYEASIDTLFLAIPDLDRFGLGDAYRGNWSIGRYGVEVVNHAKYGKVIDYNKIPAPSRAKLPVRSLLIEMCQALQDAQARQNSKAGLLMQLHVAATEGYTQYISTYYAQTGGNEAKAVELAKAAAVLMVGAGFKFNKLSGITIMDFMEAVNDLGLKELKFGKKVGNEWQNMNPQVAYRKLKQAKPAQKQAEIITEIVNVKRAGNSNARKITPDVEKLLKYIFCFMGSGQLLPPQVWDRYMSWQQQGGAVDTITGECITMPKVSLSTVKTVLNRPEVQLVATKIKHGNRIFNNHFMPYVVGKRPDYMLSVVGMDDEDAPFYLNLGGKSTWLRAKVVFIFDGGTRTIVGYAIGLGAEHELYREAIRSMIRGDIQSHTRGIMPGEVQLDHYTKGDKSEWEQYFSRINFGKAKNPQERYAEREILEWESQYMRQVPGWIGLGIKVKRYQHRQNEDAARISYTLDEIDEIYRAYIPQFNKSNGTPKPLNPNLDKMPAHLIALYAGDWSKIGIKRGFILIMINGTRYKYEVPNYETILPKLKNGFDVRVVWEAATEGNAPTQVYIFNFTDINDLMKDEYICECPIVRKVNRAQIEQDDNDKAALGHHLQRKKSLMQYVEEKAKEWEMSQYEGMTAAEAEGVMLAGYNGNKSELMQAEEILLQETTPLTPAIVSDEAEEVEYNPYAYRNKRYVHHSS